MFLKNIFNYRLLQYKLRIVSTRIQIIIIIPTFQLFVSLLLSLYFKLRIAFI